MAELLLKDMDCVHYTKTRKEYKADALWQFSDVLGGDWFWVVFVDGTWAVVPSADVVEIHYLRNKRVRALATSQCHVCIGVKAKTC